MKWILVLLITLITFTRAYAPEVDARLLDYYNTLTIIENLIVWKSHNKEIVSDLKCRKCVIIGKIRRVWEEKK